jgi:hypothetical protein
MIKPPHLRRRRLRRPEPDADVDDFGPKAWCAHCAHTLWLGLPHDERHDPWLAEIVLHTQCVARWEKRTSQPLV